MISLCVVTLDRLEEYLNIFIESVVTKTKQVQEVVIINADQDSSLSKDWTTNDIHFMLRGGTHDVFDCKSHTSLCAQHAYGLHMAEALTTQDYIWYSDPDIFFYDYVDEIYLDLMKKYEVNYIGVSRPQALSNAQLFFPGIMNIMAHRKDLPPAGYPKDLNSWTTVKPRREVDKYYIWPDTPDRNEFPNPSGHLETGCNFFLWVKQNNMKWLAFQTLDTHVYNMMYCRSNFKLTEKMPKKKLLYHASLAAGPHNHIVPFKEAFRNFLQGDTDSQ